MEYYRRRVYFVRSFLCAVFIFPVSTLILTAFVTTSLMQVLYILTLALINMYLLRHIISRNNIEVVVALVDSMGVPF